MKDKHDLTEKLKVLEIELFDKKIELQSIDQKLNVAYAYEDELLKRLESARKKTSDLKKEFFTKSQDVLNVVNRMKNIMDVFTGNFYSK